MSDPVTPGLVWRRLQEPAPATRRDLDLPALTVAAVAILDEGGAGVLTMRSLAGRLGVAVGTLYRYCRDKEELHDVALDHAWGELPEVDPASGATWRDPARAQLDAVRDLCERHAWVPGLSSSRPSIGPQGMRAAETLLATLDRAGLRGVALVAAQTMLSDLVMGHAGSEAGLEAWARRNPVDVEAVRAYVVEASAAFPHSQAVIRDVLSTVPPEELRAQRWEFAREAALDGIAARTGRH